MPNPVPKSIHKQPYLSGDQVAATVADFLSADSDQHWHIASQPIVRSLPWSTLYFLEFNLQANQVPRKFVVKIVRYPDQLTPEGSWQSSELLARGQREFESMKRVYQHFSSLPSTRLRALPPEAYLPNINAIVMAYVPGLPLFENSLTLWKLYRPGGFNAACQNLRLAGQWLRHLHELSQEDLPQDRIHRPADAVAAIAEHLAALSSYGMQTSHQPDWKSVLEDPTLQESAKLVWTHGDFHLRNIFALPDGSIMGFDTALERLDSPYYDLGKLTADLKTRRWRILRLGLLPADKTIERLAEALLEGYFGESQYSPDLLTLYEQQFMLQKWVESLDSLYASFKGTLLPLANLIKSLVINPTFDRIVRRSTANRMAHMD